MSISSTVSADGKALTIQIQGRFDFTSHEQFCEAYEKPHVYPNTYIVDMESTTYLDSAALGMLLLLNDYAGGDFRKVRIINCCPDVKKILAISNFDKLFHMH